MRATYTTWSTGSQFPTVLSWFGESSAPDHCMPIVDDRSSYFLCHGSHALLTNGQAFGAGGGTGAAVVHVVLAAFLLTGPADDDALLEHTGQMR